MINLSGFVGVNDVSTIGKSDAKILNINILEEKR